MNSFSNKNLPGYMPNTYPAHMSQVSQHHKRIKYPSRNSRIFTQSSMLKKLFYRRGNKQNLRVRRQVSKADLIVIVLLRRSLNRPNSNEDLMNLATEYLNEQHLIKAHI